MTRPCAWIAIVRKLVYVPATGKYKVVAGPWVELRRARPGSCRRAVTPGP